MKVGIFDSGIGGLSVLHQALRQMPDVSFIYYADEAHVPYGEKTTAQIRAYVDEIIEFLLGKQVDAIVIACNTATSVATKEYRSGFPVPIIGMEPAVKRAVELYPDETQRILVAATPVTIAGDKLHHLIEKVHQESRIDLVALPGLVRFAEQGDFESPEISGYLRKALQDYPLEEYKALVLGCTHFNYFTEHYKRIFPEGVRCIDGNEGTVRQLMRKLCKGETEMITPGRRTVEYYFSGELAAEAQLDLINRCMRRLENTKEYA